MDIPAGDIRHGRRCGAVVVLLWCGMVYGFWMMIAAVIYRELIEYANNDDMDHAIEIYKKSTLGTGIPQVQITNNTIRIITRKGA